MLITEVVVASVLSYVVETSPLTKTTNLAHELFEKKAIYHVIELL